MDHSRWKAVGAGGWLLLAVALGQCLWFGSNLGPPGADPIVDYPFDAGDAHDWISAGLLFAGEDVRDPARPPVLPLLVAALDRLGALFLLPWINQLAVAAGALVLWSTTRRVAGRLASLVAGLAALVGNSWLWLAVGINADVLAAVLLFACLAETVAARGSPRRYLTAGLLGGLSAATQQAALLLPVPIAVLTLWRRRGDLRRPVFWGGAAAFAAPIVLWFGAKLAVYGSVGDGATVHWGLLRPTLDGVGFYVVALLGSPGWPVLVLAGLGLVVGVRSAWAPDLRDGGEGLALRADHAVLHGAAAAIVLGFFVFLYDWRAERFVLYAFLPLLALAALGLDALRRRRALRWLSAAAVLVWSAWPLGPQPGRWLLTPLPPIELVGLPAPVGDAERLRVTETPTGASAHVAARRAGARLREAVGAESVHRSLERFASFDSAIFLHPAQRPPDFARQTRRLGNLLRKRARHAPIGLYPASWWGWDHVESAGEAAGYALYAAEVPGLPPTVLATRAGRRSLVDRRLGATVPRERPPGADETLRRVRDLSRSVGRRDTLVVLVVSGEPWEPWIPFVLRTTVLACAPPETPAVAEALERATPAEGLPPGGPIAVWRTEAAGRDATIVTSRSLRR